MRLGLNLLYLVPGEVGGTETYARELIPVLVQKLKPGDTLFLFTGRETASSFKTGGKLKVVPLPVFSRLRPLRLLFEQLVLPVYCLFYRLDLIFSLGYSAPFLHPCPSIVSIHDLNWYYQPKNFHPVTRFFWRYLTHFSAATSDAIITISHATKQSLIRIMQVPAGKITVIPLGVSTPLKIKSSEIKACLQKYHLPKRYLLSVLSHYPHKNFPDLVHIFGQLSDKFPDLHLVVGGTGTAKDRLIRQQYIAHLPQQNIHLLPYLTRRELQIIYEQAELFVFPSAYEGFGLPVLEAMNFEVPVVSSDVFALKEVVGQAGILVKPADLAGFVSGAEKILNNQKLRRQYTQAGRLQASLFTWDRCATETLKLIGQTYASK